MEDKSVKSKGLTQVEFEAQRREIAIGILKQTQEFIAWDLEFNKNISNLAEELVKQLKANPRMLDSNSEIREILKEIRAEKGQGPGFTGGDIVGGDTADEIWEIIKGILTGEKDFIRDIIVKILGL